MNTEARREVPGAELVERRSHVARGEGQVLVP